MERDLESTGDEMTKPAARIAYITQSYPGLTTTFIYREVRALESKGFDICTFAIWPPRRESLSEEARPLMDNTVYVFPIAWLRFIAAHLFFLFTRPLRYFGTALFVLTRRGESMRNRVRTFGHFGEAIYLGRHMEGQGITHIHAHFTINAASIALILARLLGVSFSFTAHNIFFIDRVLLKEKVREAHFIVAISDFSRRYLLGLVPDDNNKNRTIRDKVHIVHCGLSPDKFAPSANRAENPLPVILFVAQLSERKGAPVLVEACKILAERGRRFRCVIFGDGPQMALLRELVTAYGLEEAVDLMGAVFQEELRGHLARTDIFALPCITASNGDMDGIPVSLMEAMSMEIPVVSTYLSGIPELIRNGENGMLVEEKDVTALANALERLLDDEKLRIQLGKNGRRKVIQDFNIDSNADQLATLFEHYLK
jgi:colanic acid/amylovoran biosynthesis glycosyltransferase